MEGNRKGNRMDLQLWNINWQISSSSLTADIGLERKSRKNLEKILKKMITFV